MTRRVYDVVGTVIEKAASGRDAPAKVFPSASRMARTRAGKTGAPVAALVTFAEIAAGLGIILGAFQSELITRLAALAGIPVLIGAIVMVHGPRWSFTPADGFPMGGMEFQVVLLLIGIYFLITGNEQGQAARTG